MMPCIVFVVAYVRIFFAVRGLLKVRQMAPRAPTTARAHEPSHGAEVENTGRNDAAVDGQPGPTRHWSPISVLAGLDVEQHRVLCQSPELGLGLVLGLEALASFNITGATVVR